MHIIHSIPDVLKHAPEGHEKISMLEALSATGEGMNSKKNKKEGVSIERQDGEKW